jgi:hypothetical protein
MPSRVGIRSLRFAVAGLALALGACGDDPDVITGGTTSGLSAPSAAPSSTTTPASTTTVSTAPAAGGCAAPESLPPLVVAAGNEVLLVSHGVRSLATFDDEVWLAFGDGDDTLVVATRVGTGSASKSQLWVDAAGKRRELAAEHAPGVVLYEVGEDDGELVVVYGEILDALQTSPVVLSRLDGNDRRELGDAYGPEWAVTTASLASEYAVFSAFADLTESVFTTSLAGDERIEGRFAPEPPYGEPPLVADAVLDPSGDELAWVEGPDYSGAAPERPPEQNGVTSWQLVIADARTGEERFRKVIADFDAAIARVEWNGDTAIVSRYDEAPLIVDTTDVDAAVLEACDVHGVATIVRPRA